MKFSLKDVRLDRGMTQEELALKVGVTRQNISSIESGTSRPSPTIAKAIALILDFDWTLFYEDGEVR